MPRFNNKSITTGKKAKIQIGVVTSAELKSDLEILAKYHKRKLSDFCRIELEKVIERQENQDILNNIKHQTDNQT